jgi:serine/threonine protein kinase
MSNYPDFTFQGYRVVSELGRNREGGRITWLATQLDTNRQVVLKQFCFAQAGSDWSGYNAHQREIEILQGLNHPGIARYLTAFDTSDGFALIQEYKNAPSLATKQSFQPEEIKEIGIKVLEILVYLQNRIPPVFHRDIKPENILVNQQLDVYLIDFGFARIGSQEVSGSSVFKGTPGFIPPEQQRQPTTASDLYGLGATLICLLTGIKSTEIQSLTDDFYLIQFRHLLPKLSLRLIDWLEKMVNPKLNERFPDAETALEALRPLYLLRIPEVNLSTTNLEFQATKLGEKLVQTISISNGIPDTVLEGKWEVLPHPSDPPHQPESHSWIKLSPAKFASNQVECQIRIDTNNLMAHRVYQRQICLQTNSLVETQTLTAKVQTAPIPLATRNPPYSFVSLLLLATLVVSGMTAGVLGRFGIWGAVVALTGFGMVLAGAVQWSLHPKPIGWVRNVMMFGAGAVVGTLAEATLVAVVGAGVMAVAGGAGAVVGAVLIVVAVIIFAVTTVVFSRSDGCGWVVFMFLTGLGVWFGFVDVVRVLTSYSPTFWVFLMLCFFSLILLWASCSLGSIGFKDRFEIGWFIPFWSRNIALGVAMIKPETFKELTELKVWAESTSKAGINNESLVALIVLGSLPGAVAALAVIASPILGWVIAGVKLAITTTVKGFINQGFKAIFIILLLVVTLVFGVTLGIGLTVGLLNYLVLLSLFASGLPLVAMLMYSPIKRAQLIAKYRQGEQLLIKP